LIDFKTGYDQGSVEKAKRTNTRRVILSPRILPTD